jgi:hypothetical protein
LLVQNKVTKQKDTPCRFSPVLLTITGGNQTRPSGLHKPQATAELKQVIAEPSRYASAARRGRGELKTYGISSFRRKPESRGFV